MKHKTVYDKDIEKLDFEINLFLELDWKLKGEMFAYNGVFYQPMIHEDDDPDFPRVDDVE